MLIEMVLKEAQSSLQGKRVRDLVIGISLLAVELHDSNIGVSYVLREDLLSGCSIFPYGQEVLGERASEIAEWSLEGHDSLQRSIGIAVLGAASREKRLKDIEDSTDPFGMTLKDSDRVGMIGFIGLIAKMIEGRVKELIVFDKGGSKCGGVNTDVLPIEQQMNVLPTCDIVVLSGTTMINGSIDHLLNMCTNAREVVMIGPSTPMFPEAFLDTKVTVLAGAWWKREYEDSIFKKISLGCGIPDLSTYIIKKTVGVHPC